MLIEVEVSSFAIEPQRSVPLVILREKGGGRSIAVPVDPVEACAIAMHSMQVQTEKPFTVDLVKLAIEALGGSLYRVLFSDVEDGAFVTSIVIKSGTALRKIDCRACDAVALAMRCGSQIFVSEDVFNKLGIGSGVSAEDELRARVRSLDVVDFGKFVLG